VHWDGCITGAISKGCAVPVVADMVATFGRGLWMDAKMLPQSGQEGGGGRNQSNNSYPLHETAANHSSLLVRSLLYLW